ncbi:MAG TPA: glycosyltransferase family 2 protein [Woeseiaceae bacterium]|nr:glycosyltransferase family 2 protein [Woeseiaceae bacterium]
MPIYNEERFLALAIESLRSQEYSNIQILISDNASTDRTGEIGRKAADEDERITYLRTDSNIGAIANFRLVLEKADGDYFMWAAGHDVWSPNLIAESVAILEGNKTATLAFASSYWINAAGERDNRDTDYPDTRHKSVFSRFFTVFWGNMHPVLGLMRMRNLKQTHGMQNFAGADLVLLSEMILMGDFVHAPNAWWDRRDVRKKETHAERMERYADPQFGQATTALDRRFPLLRLPIALIGVVWRAPITWSQRLLILAALLPLLPIRYVVGRRKANANRD